MANAWPLGLGLGKCRQQCLALTCALTFAFFPRRWEEGPRCVWPRDTQSLEQRETGLRGRSAISCPLASWASEPSLSWNQRKTEKANEKTGKDRAESMVLLLGI